MIFNSIEAFVEHIMNDFIDESKQDKHYLINTYCFLKYFRLKLPISFLNVFYQEHKLFCDLLLSFLEDEGLTKYRNRKMQKQIEKAKTLDDYETLYFYWQKKASRKSRSMQKGIFV